MIANTNLDPVTTDKPLDPVTGNKPLDECVTGDEPLDPVTGDKPLDPVTADKPLDECVTGDKPLDHVTGDKPLDPVTGDKPLDECDDLNFHVDNAADSNAMNFLDLLDLLNFSQHVTSITHKAGHTLDLVITCDSEAVIDNVTISDLLSDHTLVLVHVKYPKPLPTWITTITRKLRGLDDTLLAAEISTLASKTVHTDA